MSLTEENRTNTTQPSAQEPTGPSSTAYAIYILILLTAANVMSYADRYIFSIAMPAIQKEFQISDSSLGLIAGPAFTISYLLFAMPLAGLADRWSRRRILAASITVWSLATSACGAASNALQLTISRFIVGAGEAGAMPPSQSMISQLFPPHRRSTALGILGAAPYFGLVVGLAGGGYLASTFGWRWAFYAMAFAGLPLALLIWLTGPKRTAAFSAQMADKRNSATSWAVMKEFWSIKSLRLMALAIGIFNIFGYAGSIWMPTFLMRSHEMSAAEAGILLGICSTIGGVLGSFSSGAMVDRLVRRNPAWQLRLPALFFMMSFPIFWLMFTMPAGQALRIGGFSIPVVGIYMLISSFLSAAWMGPGFASVAQLFAPERRTQAAAVLIIVINVVGSAFGPVLAGLVSDALGLRFGEDALRVSLLGMSSLTLVGGALFLRASAHYQHDTARLHVAPIAQG